MPKDLILQFITLTFYLFLMGFIFCDFFKLKTSVKLIWFFIFLIISIYVFNVYREFKLDLILPLPTLLAIGLGWSKRKR